MSRRISLSAAVLAAMVLAGTFGQTAFAQGTTVIPPPPGASGASFVDYDDTRAFNSTTGQNMHWDCNKKTWIDSKTGEPVSGGFDGRRGSDGEVIPPPPATSGASFVDYDDTRAFNSTTGQNMHWDPDQKTWIDSKTGQPVPGGFNGRRGKACPPPGTSAPSNKPLVQTEFDKKLRERLRTGGRPGVEVRTKEEQEERVEIGMYLGGELLNNWGFVRSTERSVDTGAVTNQFSDSGDPIGGGIVAGYNFRPWNNNIVVGPFASFDFLNQTINHNGAGFLLGTTTHWIITAGAKGGYVVTPGLYLYGLAGASWLNQSLNVNFATAASSNVTTPGFTLGLGSEYQPSSWRLFGNPVSVFMQYQHTWWGTANFNTPTSSPFFNYAFQRSDDTIKLGVNVYLSH
jgi:hypothetical protein